MIPIFHYIYIIGRQLENIFYSADVLLLGGFDKMPLYEGPEAILAELKRIAPLVEIRVLHHHFGRRVLLHSGLYQ